VDEPRIDGSVDASPERAEASSPPSCELTETVRFGRGGGFINTTTTARLDPPGVLTITYQSSAGEKSCSPPLPACGIEDLDLSDIVRDLADPDVQAVLREASPPLFGQAAADAGTFRFQDPAGHGFQFASADCSTASSPSSCTVPPQGIVRLVADLDALEALGLSDPACATLMQ
jgi:hypothetical protein